MRKFLLRRIFDRFIKSFIWIAIPAAIWLVPIAYDIYEDAGTSLTPYSVYVKGYQKSDGTHINPYSRRPPGSVEHDSPYKIKRLIVFWSMVALLLFCLKSVFNFTVYAYKEIKNRNNNYEVFTKAMEEKNTFWNYREKFRFKDRF